MNDCSIKIMLIVALTIGTIIIMLLSFHALTEAYRNFKKRN